MLDIDWFKKINDVRGHASGDEVLKKFAEEGHAGLRTSDVLARWGGEEFLLYLPGTTLVEARVVVERLRQQVQALSFRSNGAGFGITFSVGLVELMNNEAIDLGIRRADALLYKAKASGRNRVTTALADNCMAAS